MQTKDELEPLTLAEPSSSTHWREAMEREYRLLVHNDTWELVPLLPNKIVVSGKYGYRAKTDARGTIQQHKAKYVARGFTQQPGIDLTKTTLLVVAVTSLQALLAIAIERDMEIKQLDVDLAFLYGDLNKEIYLKQPEGF